MKSYVFIIAGVFWWLNTWHSYAHPLSVPDTSQAETIRALKKMKASIKGTTENGHQYEMYAIKAKKDWLFLVKDSLGLSALRFDNTNGELMESEPSINEILYLSVKANSLKKKDKARTIAGTDLECYYKMQSKAVKLYNSAKDMNGKAAKMGRKVKQEYMKGKRTKNKIKSTSNKIKRVKNSKGKSLL
jgi:hypothetical protein